GLLEAVLADLGVQGAPRALEQVGRLLAGAAGPAQGGDDRAPLGLLQREQLIVVVVAARGGALPRRQGRAHLRREGRRGGLVAGRGRGGQVAQGHQARDDVL